MKNLFLVFILPVFLFSCRQKAEIDANTESNHTALNDTLTQKLKAAYKKGAIVGFSVAVVDEEGVLYDKGFGFTDVEQQKAYTSGTVQNIASISKTLIGVSLLKAQELGKLNLNDPINKYLPFKIVNPNHPEIPILIKHLAYHSSSISELDAVYAKSYVLTKNEHAENEGVFDYFNKPETNIPLVDFIQNSLSEDGKWYGRETFLDTKPGAKRAYSNIGAALCALVIERATGQDYRSFTKEYILKPLKMNASGWTEKDIDVAKRTRLFANKEKMIADYNLITYADGGFLTSSSDLGLFLSELIKGYGGKGTLLGQESYKELFEKHQFLSDGESEEVGVFLEFRDGFLNVKKDIIGHNGSDPGVFTAMYFNPKTRIGTVVLVNTDTDFTDGVWPEIEEIWKSLSEYNSK